MDESGVNIGPIIGKITEQGALAAFMLLVILALLWLVKYLIKRNETLTDKVMSVVENNTAAFEKWTEVQRAKNNQQN